MQGMKNALHFFRKVVNMNNNKLLVVVLSLATDKRIGSNVLKASEIIEKK